MHTAPTSDGTRFLAEMDRLGLGVFVGRAREEIAGMDLDAIRRKLDLPFAVNRDLEGLTPEEMVHRVMAAKLLAFRRLYLATLVLGVILVVAAFLT